ncbi:MAG: hypothetical protein ACLQGU_02560 [bacterium]
MLVKNVEIQFARNSKGSLKAIAGIVLENDWGIYGFRICTDREGGRVWVVSPTLTKKNPLSQRIEYTELLRVPEIDKVQIEEAILSAFRRKIREAENGREFSRQAP